MRLSKVYTDTFNHGPDGHPDPTEDGCEIDEARLVEILKTHNASRCVRDGSIYLRGRDYPGFEVHGIPEELLDRLGIPAVNTGEREAG